MTTPGPSAPAPGASTGGPSVPGLSDPGLLRQAAWIGGVERSCKASIEVTNPASGQVLGRVPDLGAEGTLAAVAAAREALPAWRGLTAKARSVILRRWYDRVMEAKSDLARLLTAEQGKPLAEAEGEIVYAAAFIEWFAEEARRAYGDVIPGHQADKRLLVLKQAVGVVAAVTPWNFPAAMVTRKVAPALAAGCTVVLKPSELTPFTALALAVLADEAGVPAGVFNVVTGAPAPIGEVLTASPDVAKFTFTGSTAVGKRLAAACMGTVKRVSLELGGNAPFIIFDDADLEAAAEGLLASKFRNTGQTCVCANRIYVQAGIYDAFAAALAARVSALRVGDGLAGPTDQGPLINAAALDKVERHVADALAGGARVLAGAQRLPGEGSFYAPTVLTDVAPGALINREETFGPVAGLVRFTTEAEVLALANDTRSGLAAYVYTRDLSRSWRMSEGLEAGMVGLNTGLISTEVAPFGGVKESGLGREGSRYGLEEYLETKMVCLSV
ncbi:NAD-dependent succinate-semialdehyde dehydrogenase [Phenylobacterium sp.]|uniref:NAD-dependent succinate-semialdehyde dehydrogenase n=1 Tax=Phenylobacterium sp. TaxID=1871053 RepID=UPI0025FB784B|nr:NAD-dependent succinate-semialdehyde dehydrogenase [Phenylobacterium sp.]MCA6285442.1 NAD-dependent succinate-semialdehyde dehydrogenase [Phenylobacterium sp.]MCA6289255.1 NAD-dependent succinate-semialdehyde dehydrogenase [Phenylobacterium sp.]MCA6309541.1 NAD-dependent succinate-semialdehyde dehydrogenase [Phenylobacterium sp.]MCA6323058.1 NAD-dependent succinate-semialdehyde dehydrogenase [Phenylobacterium sp.]MCA6337518.1 NAD-dependent succinate-semialdehyde dehydrogenase [Phenylobacter